MGYYTKEEQASEWPNYKPFEGGMPYQVHQGQLPKCYYCGKPNMHANCHAHDRDCPYYCGNNPAPSAPLSDGLAILIGFAFAYLSYKIFTRKVNKL